MKTYIITGANGFLGNNIIRLLQEEACDIRALVLPDDKLHSLEGLRCTVYRGDVTKNETLSEIFTVPDGAEVIVIHCAAIVTVKSKFNPKVYDVNVNGALNIAERALAIGARLVYVSSVHAIPERGQKIICETKQFDPALVTGQYAKTKAETANALLKMVNERGLDCVIVHPSGMLGPYDFGHSHLTQLVLDFSNGKLTACVKGGYDFSDARDVAAGILSAAERGRTGECYILSLKQGETHVLGEATIIKRLGDNDYLAEYNGVKCHAIFNPFAGRYFVDDVYGVIRNSPDRDSR